MRRSWLVVLVALSACREERSVFLNDWLEARLKKPISGLFSLQPSVNVLLRGKSIIDTQDLYYLSFGQSIALRDDVNHRVLMVDHDGRMTELPCPDGASLAPPRFPGVDCWAGHTASDFAITRYAANGRVVRTMSAPAAAKACGDKQIGYVGYDPRGEPVVSYECTIEGQRMCHATTLEETPVAMGEMPATTAGVDCGYLIRTSGKRLDDVQAWSKVE